MTIISPYAKPGVYHQQTTNVSILSFMQKLWGLPHGAIRQPLDSDDVQRPSELHADVPTAGYYRVAATGPNGGTGWATVDVGTTPATAPPQ